MKLVLVLLILLSAPLSVAQPAGCDESRATVTGLFVNHDAGQHAAGQQHGEEAGSSVAASAHGNCDSCDLDCLSACAPMALPISLSGPEALAPATEPVPGIVPALRDPHLPALLRPPSLSLA